MIFAKVFGIPAAGRCIVNSVAKRSVSEVAMPALAGQINLSQLHSIKAAQAVLVRDRDGLMTLTEQDEFKAAFVLFVMSSLFAP